MDKINTIDTVACYGTLKKLFSNHGVMDLARGEYIGSDYVRVKELQSGGFPMAKFTNEGNKWLKVELYNVPIKGIEGPLDSLEGCNYGPYSLYHRVKIDTLNKRSVWIYEIARNIKDGLEEFYTHKEGENLFYNWK